MCKLEVRVTMVQKDGDTQKALAEQSPRPEVCALSICLVERLNPTRVFKS